MQCPVLRYISQFIALESDIFLCLTQNTTLLQLFHTKLYIIIISNNIVGNGLDRSDYPKVSCSSAE